MVKKVCGYMSKKPACVSYFEMFFASLLSYVMLRYVKFIFSLFLFVCMDHELIIKKK